MILLQKPKLDELQNCSYLPRQQKQFHYFFAKELDEVEIAYILNRGWRKFGPYFFRPSCPHCQACTPLRVLTHEFQPSKSQRKTLRKNQAVQVKFGPLEYSDRIYEIYSNHSEVRFQQENGVDGFLFNFYSPSCPAIQSEYYLHDALIAVGFLDVAADGLSSVYFVYDTAYSHLGLGTFSILQEIAYAKQLGLPYYYLGYYVADCRRMAYKDRFQPREHLNWETDSWERVTEV